MRKCKNCNSDLYWGWPFDFCKNCGRKAKLKYKAVGHMRGHSVPLPKLQNGHSQAPEGRGK